MGECLLVRRGGAGGIEKMEDYGTIAYKSSNSSSSTVTVTATVPTNGTFLVIVHDTINQNRGNTSLGLTGNCTIVLIKDGVVKAVKSRQLETVYSGNNITGYSQNYYYRDASSTASATISGTTLTITHPWDSSTKVGGMYGTTIFELS